MIESPLGASGEPVGCASPRGAVLVSRKPSWLQAATLRADAPHQQPPPYNRARMRLAAPSNSTTKKDSPSRNSPWTTPATRPWIPRNPSQRKVRTPSPQAPPAYRAIGISDPFSWTTATTSVSPGADGVAAGGWEAPGSPIPRSAKGTRRRMSDMWRSYCGCPGASTRWLPTRCPPRPAPDLGSARDGGHFGSIGRPGRFRGMAGGEGTCAPGKGDVPCPAATASAARSQPS